jgi:predicted glycosyltransferase
MREEDRQVLFSVGAGGDGSQILLQALKSRDYCPNLKKRTWHLITGNRAENGFLAELANEAASRGFIVDCPDINIENRNPDIIISKDCPDFKQRLVDAFIAVIGGGYNTVIEALKGGARVVASALFKWNGENLTLHPEQASRLRHMKEAGFLRTLGTDELKDPKKLAGALEMIAGQEPGAIPEIKTHGAMVTAALIGQWYSDHLVSPLRDHPGAISRRDSLLTADT